MINISKLAFFLFFINLTYISCKKEEKKKEPKFPPSVLSPYHISAYVDGNFIDAAYSYQDPDTIGSVYSTSNNQFHISRYVSQTSNEGWSIHGYNNLLSLSYPITFWGSKSLYNGIFVVYNVRDGGYSPNKFDSTLFSITLINFDHDTLSGTFQGKLFRPSNYTFPDSMVTITNGLFKVLLVKFH